MDRRPRGARAHVLVYHDDPVILQLVRDILAPSYKVTLALNPSELEAQMAIVRPDLLVLGLPAANRAAPPRFPEMIRNIGGRAIPKVALTTEDNLPGTLGAAFDEVICEPFRISTLRDAVGRLAPIELMRPGSA
ncbi:MAG: hypothetical protein ACM3JD_13180 [Rudaea sp.]